MAGTLSLGTVILSASLALGAVAIALLAEKRRANDAIPRRLRLIMGKDGAGPGGAEQTSPLTWVLNALAALSQRVGRFAVLGDKEQRQLETALLAAGFRRPDGIRILMASKVLAMAAGAAFSAGLLWTQGQGTTMIGAGAMLGGLLGGRLPGVFVSRMARRRQARLLARLPDALDLLIIYANAGYGLDQAVQRLARDLARGAPDLCDEFALTSTDLRLLPSREEALGNLAKRTGVEPIRALVSTLIQSLRYGTPLSQALRVLAAEQRNRRIIDMEERAARVPVLITIPLILLILPAVLIIAGAPAMINASKNWGGGAAFNASQRSR